MTNADRPIGGLLGLPSWLGVGERRLETSLSVERCEALLQQAISPAWSARSGRLTGSIQDGVARIRFKDSLRKPFRPTLQIRLSSNGFGARLDYGFLTLPYWGFGEYLPAFLVPAAIAILDQLGVRLPSYISWSLFHGYYTLGALFPLVVLVFAAFWIGGALARRRLERFMKATLTGARTGSFVT